MNTLSYFLSTLRPSPPPSPRASTSALPIPLPLGLDSPDLVDPSRPARSSSRRSASEELLDQDATSHQLDADASAELLDTDGESSKNGDRGPSSSLAPSSPPSLDLDAVFVSDPRMGEPPRIGVIPPSRRGSRKGKSRADDSAAAMLDPSQLDEKLSSAASEDCSGPSPSYGADKGAASATIVLSSSSDRRGSSWPFVSRLAQTWPFRLTASFYILVRRFLSLFGLGVPPRPQFNSLLAPLSTEDPEKLALSPGERHSTVVSLRISSTPDSSPPPSPSTPSTHTVGKIPRPLRTPPRMTPKTLVLDLDETLIHSTSRSGGHGGRGRNVPKGLKTTMVEVVLDGRSTVYTVYKRPWVDFFLRKVSSWYTVIIFTASLPEYADPVIDWLDGGDGRGGLIGGRLFRAHCLAKNGTYVKDLTVVDQDLAKVCLVDNSPVSYAINQANGIPIEGWINDPHDECLLDLLPMLDSLRFTNDVRRVLGLRGFGKAAAAAGLANAVGHGATVSGGGAGLGSAAALGAVGGGGSGMTGPVGKRVEMRRKHDR